MEDIATRLLLDEFIQSGDRQQNSVMLYYAAKFGKLETVKHLLDNCDVDVSIMDCDHHTPLSLSAEVGHNAIIRLLLEQSSASHQYTAMHIGRALQHAANTGRTDIVHLLLANVRSPVNLTFGCGNLAMVNAIRGGHVPLVRSLLHGYPSYARSKDWHWGPELVDAARKGRQAMVEVLVQTRVVGMKEEALCNAAAEGHLDVAEHLLNSGQVNVNASLRTSLGWSGETALSLAARHGHDSVVELLLRTGLANVNSQASFVGERGPHDPPVHPLSLPVRPDVEGRTPLMWAAKNGHEKIVKLLLCAESTRVEATEEDCRYRIRYVNTALDHARRKGHEGIIDMLERAMKSGTPNPEAGELRSMSHILP